MPNGKYLSKSDHSSVRRHIEETMCGFANANGGLLVVGISKYGDILGIDHLTEKQKSSLMDVTSLRGAVIQVKTFDIPSDDDMTLQIALFMVDPDDRTFCRRIRDDSSWVRKGASTVPLRGEELEQLKRDRKVVEFERATACHFQDQDVDQTVVSEFIKSNEIFGERTIGEILRDTGSISTTNDESEWTNSGLLFFNLNPQRILGYAYIRLLRFDCSYEDEDERPTPDFDQNFDGSLTSQIRSLRTFIRESGFFKKFEFRSPEGGFISEPEYPEVAIDEAIVNAVAHRDYGIPRPIICEKYTDAFVVKSPGKLIQPEEIPEKFRLNEIRLESVPRNSKLIEWLRSMKDARGVSYVKALREGTRKMRDEMANLDLPAPKFEVKSLETAVILENNIEQRTTKPTGLASGQSIISNEFTNLYFLGGLSQSGTPEGKREEKRIVLQAICDKLEVFDWIVADLKMGRAVVHKRGVRHPIPEEINKVLRIIPAYILNIRTHFEREFLVVDFTVRLRTNWRLPQAIAKFGINEMIGLNSVAVIDGKLLRGRIAEIDQGCAVLHTFRDNKETKVKVDSVFPNLRRIQISQILDEIAPNFDLSREIKTAALFNTPSAARQRAANINQTVELIANAIFPIHVGSKTITLSNEPLRLTVDGDGKRAWRVSHVSEPEVEFGHSRATANIRDGITTFGSYKFEPRQLDIVGIVQPSYEIKIRELVTRLQRGSYKFKGVERTFATRIRLAQVNTAREISVQEECKRLIREFPEWSENNDLSRLMLVQTPEADFALDDTNSPYYQSKRALLEAGIPCQMIDTPTLINPDYKDLNLALNIVAKTGGTPWVLPESIPDADCFVGLSYTSNQDYPNNRLVGFANVFNEYGRWEFYSSGNESVPYDERAQHYETLVQNTLEKLQLRKHPTVYFHYSAKFSRIDREAILRGARKVRPLGKFVFVWINSHHLIRLFDERAETDGSLVRGRYAIGEKNQIYVSTTGSNPYRRTLGTPITLEVNYRMENLNHTTSTNNLDHKTIASQILNLTKLNWASTDSLCGEPITIKYAKNIAYLTAAFQRQKMGNFRLHKNLERTPWFI